MERVSLIACVWSGLAFSGTSAESCGTVSGIRNFQFATRSLVAGRRGPTAVKRLGRPRRGRWDLGSRAGRVVCVFRGVLQPAACDSRGRFYHPRISHRHASNLPWAKGLTQ